ncbi:class I SAM-dependent methyltransferase [Kangiella sp. HZ709]|uniref:class I SAM-dependent methyltransferase n=1 Tax=Kangiella sp. HZ709 TaxID=2666328 RepID=UPI00351B55DB
MANQFAFFQSAEFPKKQSPDWLVGLPVVKHQNQLTDYQGYFSYQQVNEQLALSFSAELDGKRVFMFVDLMTGQVGYRRQHGGGRKQHIAKACGLKANWNPKVLDATGGLGRDAAELRSLGCDLRIIERSPFIASLLQDGITRASLSTDNKLFSQGFDLHHGQSVELIKKLSQSEKADIIYLDPMFPPKQKSAAVKKEMRLVKLLVGEDPDADNLLPVALAHAQKRVVVKRPSYAPYLNEQKPSMSIESKGNRFDVYVNN